MVLQRMGGGRGGECWFFGGDWVGEKVERKNEMKEGILVGLGRLKKRSGKEKKRKEKKKKKKEKKKEKKKRRKRKKEKRKRA